MTDFQGFSGISIMAAFFNTLLLGIVLPQYWSYLSASRQDSIAVRISVLTLFMNDTFMSALMVYMVWHFSVAGIRGTDNFNVEFWPYSYVPIGTVLTALLVHAITSHKIYSMSGSPLLYGALVLVSVAAFGTGFYYGVRSWNLAVSVSVNESLKSLIVCWLSIQIVSDILTAGLAIYLLRKHRSGPRKNVMVIDRLIRGAIQMGVLPAVFAATALVAFVVNSHANLYMMFIIPIGRLYTTSFLNSLNVRGELKDRLLGNVNQNEGIDQVVSAVMLRDLSANCQSPAGDDDHISSHGKKPSLHLPFHAIIETTQGGEDTWV